VAAYLPGENDSSLARVRLEALALEISALNDKKRGWQNAWEVESQRMGDPNLEKPVELRALNKQLGPLYGEKSDLLERFPHLQAEYGGKRQVKHVPTTTVANATVKAERAARKRQNHERNLARRREEDRARARGGTGGGGKKKQ
jgi:hypothetical protein